MGATDSKLGNSQPPDGITTVKGPVEETDLTLEKLKSLKIATPLLKAPPTESTLSDILVRKGPSSSLETGAENSKIVLELFTVYREWQENTVKRINQNQEELENRIEIADALATKLIKRFGDSASDMKTGVAYLEDVYPLQVEIGVLKGKLKEVISNCDALCKRINEEGPETLRGKITPFAVGSKHLIKPPGIEKVS